MSLTAKERLEIVAANLQELELNDYGAYYALNNYALDIINISALFLQEYYAKEEAAN